MCAYICAHYSIEQFPIIFPIIPRQSSMLSIERKRGRPATARCTSWRPNNTVRARKANQSEVNWSSRAATAVSNVLIYYLRQVNEVNGGDNAFVRCVSVCLSVCLSVCVCAAAGQWELNANSSKTVKATDLKFDTSLPRESPDMTPKIFFQKGAWPESRDPYFFRR